MHFKELFLVSTMVFLLGGSLIGSECVFNLNTGYDRELEVVLAQGIVDDNYIIDGPLGLVDAVTVPEGVFPIPPWLDYSEGNSLWISVATDTNGPAGNYTYEITFQVPDEVDPTQLILEGKWLNDDGGVDILINGTSTGISTGGFGIWSEFPPLTGMGLFHDGDNMVQFIVSNSTPDGNPTGLRVEACVVIPDQVPEDRPFNISTGFDETAKEVLADGVVDSSITITGPAGSGITGSPVAIAADSIPGSWYPKTVNSRWVGPASAFAGEYSYEIDVTLSSAQLDPDLAILKGGFAADSQVTDVLVNGESLGLVSNGTSNLTPFPVTAGQGLLKDGPNKIEFVVTKAEDETTDTGLRVDGQVVAGPPIVDAPASFLSLDTGYDNELNMTIENSLPDDNWVVIGPPGSDVVPQMATVVPDNDFPIPPWIASTSQSKWIGVNAISSNGPSGVFTFRIKVEVPEGIAAEDLMIIGSVSSDNGGVDTLINGNSLGIAPTGAFNVMEQIPENTGIGLFHTGENVVEFLVENNGSGPVGLRVEAVVGLAASSLNNLSTGVDTRGGILLPAGGEDLRYTVTGPDGGDPYPAVIVAEDGDPIPPWLADSETSQWIGLNGEDSIGTAGQYTYLVNFPLPINLNPARVVLKGGWAGAEKGVDVLLNGTSLESVSADPGVLTTFPAGTGQGLFVPGNNTLQFVVENTGPVSTGLRADISLDAGPKANPLDISTGFDRVNGEVLPDYDVGDYYVINTLGEEEDAIVVAEIDMPAAWIANSETSRWIGISDPLLAPLGTYIYGTVVNIPTQEQADNGVIQGVWASDNNGMDVVINGVSTGLTNGTGFSGFASFPDNFGLGMFKMGDNTIEFEIQNEGDTGNPSGLRVDAEVVVETGNGETLFLRGDTNADGSINLADAIFVLSYLFSGGAEPDCVDTADANDDGSINLADAISILSYLFGGAGDLPEPFGDCGTDPTPGDELPCPSFGPCSG